MARLLATNPHGCLVISHLTNLKHSRCAQHSAGAEYGSQSQSRMPINSGGMLRQRHEQLRCSAAGDGSAAAPGQTEKPQWLRELEEDAREDPDIARLLEGTLGDPEVVQQRMQDYMIRGKNDMISERLGVEEPMQVTLREIDTFNCWIWMELHEPPGEEDVNMISELMRSWFVMGRLGGYNGMNLQIFNRATEEGASNLEYDVEECESSLTAFFHDMSNTESKGNWLRTWVNMGTADELALDILVNVLSNFSKEHLGIKQLCVGGENDDWKVPEMQLPKSTMDPMQVDTSAFDDEDY